MAILGIGIDVVEVARMEAAVGHPDRGRRFRERVFTEGERAYCDAKASSAASYAVRFAAKEAVMKALGRDTAWGFPWLDIEVVRPDDGAPQIRLHGRAQKLAAARGATHVHVSLTHERSVAAAQVILES